MVVKNKLGRGLWKERRQHKEWYDLGPFRHPPRVKKGVSDLWVYNGDALLFRRRACQSCASLIAILDFNPKSQLNQL